MFCSLNGRLYYGSIVFISSLRNSLILTLDTGHGRQNAVDDEYDRCKELQDLNRLNAIGLKVEAKDEGVQEVREQEDEACK